MNLATTGVLIASLLALSACSDTAASSDTLDTGLVIEKRAGSPQQVGRSAVAFELTPQQPGFVFVHLRDTMQPQHDRWQPEWVGNTPRPKPTMHGTTVINTIGEAASSSLHFHVLERDVGKPVQLQFEFDASADGTLRTVRCDLQFPPANTGDVETSKTPNWFQSTADDLRASKSAWRSKLTVPSGERRDLGFVAWSRDVDTVNRIQATVDATTTTIAVSDDATAANYGRAAVLEICWLAESF